MSPLTLALLRRAAIYAAVAAALLLTVPRIFGFFGVLGPGPEEELAAVERALDAARSYGALPDEPHYARAAQAVDAARALVEQKDRWRSRRAIQDARELSIAAQRVALANREESRREAHKAVLEIDRLVNDLEDTYAEATRGMSKDEQARLFSRMKSARQKSAALFLAFDEGNHTRVLDQEKLAREALAAAKAELLAAAARPRTRPQS
jgi:hypothetical protein